MALESGSPARCRSIAALVLLVLVIAVATPAADAARTVRHSGTVAALDPEGDVMILEEVGPWRVERGTTVVTRRTISLTASTKYNLFMRVNAPGAFAGDFTEVVLDVNDDLMSRNVVTIRETEGCHRAVEMLCQHKIRHLPVVDARGTLVGIVTDRDLRHYLFRPRVLRDVGAVPVARLLDRVEVREIMSTPVVTVGPDEPLETAARLMLEDKVGSVPVVADGYVVGILTETDLLRRIVGEDTALTDVECIVVSYP